MKLLRAIFNNGKKMLTSQGFVFCILLTTFLCFTSNGYVDESTGREYTVFEVIFSFDKEKLLSDVAFSSFQIWFQSIGTYYMTLFIPIVAAIPFLSIFEVERRSGLIRFEIARMGEARYYFSKFIGAFLSGGLAIMFGFLLYGFIISLIFPNERVYFANPELNPIIVHHQGFLNVIKVLTAMFLYGAVSVMPAFFFSSFIKNRYIIASLPFLIIYLYQIVLNKIIANQYSIGNVDIYEKIAPWKPDSVSQVFWSAGNKGAIVLLQAVSVALYLLGFVLIMKKRRDKGE